MRRLANTLYVFSEGTYLSLDGENVVARRENQEVGRVPLHTLEAIMSFSYAGASPALMGACAQKGISLSFFDMRGRFLAGVHGEQHGNIALRKTQYAWSTDPERTLNIARGCILGKLFNCKWLIERSLRDHGPRLEAASLKTVSRRLGSSLEAARSCDTLERLRGIEGDAAAGYFSIFDQLLLRDKETFSFDGRTRRPPTDEVNAMLSLFYTVLANDCSSALSGVGLDPYIGFLHTDRPGRCSLALDLMEELRPVFVDRFVITAVNNRIVRPSHFERRETGEVRLTEDGRRRLFDFWQERKREAITHPFLKEKMPRGLVPHIQAQLLARYLRGDLDGYPPFFWK